MALADILPNDTTDAVRTKLNAAIDAVAALVGEPSRAQKAEQDLSQSVAAKAQQVDLTAEAQARQALTTALQIYKAALLQAATRPGDAPTFFGMATDPTVISITPSNDLGTDYLKTAINGLVLGGVDSLYAAMVAYTSRGSAAAIAFDAPKVPAGGPFETLLGRWLQLSTTASRPGPGLGYTAAQAASTIASLRTQALAAQVGTTALPADPSQWPPIPAGSLVVGAEGAVCRLYGGAYVAASTFFAVEPDRVYAATVAFTRSQDPADPSGDDVRFGLFVYDAGKTLIGTLLVTDFTDPTVAAGRQKGMGFFSRLASAPTGTALLGAAVRYVRPFLRTFGGAQQTDVEVVSWRDVTDILAAGLTVQPPGAGLPQQIDTYRYKKAIDAAYPSIAPSAVDAMLAYCQAIGASGNGNPPGSVAMQAATANIPAPSHGDFETLVLRPWLSGAPSGQSPGLGLSSTSTPTIDAAVATLQANAAKLAY